MNIIGGNEKGKSSTKKKVIIAASSVLVVAAISVGTLFLLNSKNADDAKAETIKEDENEVKSVALTEEDKEKYEKAGIETDKDKLKEQNEETAKKVEDQIDSSDIGSIPEDSPQAERYKDSEVQEMIKKIARETKASRHKAEGSTPAKNSSSPGKSSKNGGGAAGNDSNSNSNSDSEDEKDPEKDKNGPEDLNTDREKDEIENKDDHDEESDKDGEVVNDDLESIDIVTAAGTIEIQTTMRTVKNTISKNLENQSGNYDALLLKHTLDSLSQGNQGELSGIDSITYGQMLHIVKHWLFYYPEEAFSWKRITQSPTLYSNIVGKSLYKNDFSNIYNQVVTIVDNGSKIDAEFIAFNMVFTSNGKAYRGIFSIEDNMPRLLDLQVL